MNLTLRVSCDNGTIVVAASGEIDLQNSGELRTQLLASLEQRKDLAVDLTQVSYIDSSGVAGLIEAYQMARRLGRRFSLAAVSPAVLRVLKLARLDEVFGIAGAEPAAQG